MVSNMSKPSLCILLTILVLSSISFVVQIVSIATRSWVIGGASNPNASGDSEVNYGLFGGTLIRHVLSSPQRYDLTVTCDYSNSACMYSCQVTQQKRTDELHRLLAGEPLDPCPFFARSFSTAPLTGKAESPPTIDYMKADLYWSTLVFLIMGIVFTFISIGFTVFNLLYNPVEPIFGVLGLYIWNALSTLGVFLAIVLWASLFHGYLAHNLAITDTLSQLYTSEGQAIIGYSFYILIVPLFLSIANIAVLILRNRIADWDTTTVRHMDKPDATLEFF